MITRTILHALWAAIVFVFAVTVALGVLFMLGAAWVGDELRAAAPHDPMLRHGAASVFGMVLFVGTVTPALTVLPAAIAAIAGEALRIRSWMYYVLAGGAAMAAIPVLASPAERSASRASHRPIHDHLRCGRLRRRLRLLAAGWAERLKTRWDRSPFVWGRSLRRKTSLVLEM